MERRGVLRVFAFLFGGLCGGSGLATLFDPLRRHKGGWQVVAKLDELPAGATRVRLQVRAGWETLSRSLYLMRDQNEVVAYDARCTHLGCTVHFKKSEFVCPCHRGIFDNKGNPVSGPVREPLGRLETRIHNGMVEVRA
ncbi:MAG: QcrA and Rieske domain-containing protein [Planctomycetota bacterium]|jgi:Rieske Fe-S protein